MANGFVAAEIFELTGGAASITYDARSGRLHYRGPSHPSLDDVLDVSQSVAPVDTPIGRLITAALVGDDNTVTVLLPEINLESTGVGRGTSEATFETVALFTRKRLSTGGTASVEGPLHTYTSVAMEARARLAPCAFTATLHRELPGPAVLRVEGTCTYGSTGYKGRLVRHEPQGANPRELLLRLVAKRPQFGGPAFITYPVSYEEQTDAGFDTVTILPDGVSVEVRVVS